MIMAVIFAVLATLMLVELTYYIFPTHQAEPSLPPPGPYSTQAPLLSSQNYVLLLAASFIMAVGATVAIMLLTKWNRQRKLNH